MRTSTPLFAKQMSFKYANANAGTVVADFAQHGRKVARSYVGEVAADVASVCAEKEGNWNYEVPRAPAGERVGSVGIGVDGTCALGSEDDVCRAALPFGDCGAGGRVDFRLSLSYTLTAGYALQNFVEARVQTDLVADQFGCQEHALQ